MKYYELNDILHDKENQKIEIASYVAATKFQLIFLFVIMLCLFHLVSLPNLISMSLLFTAMTSFDY